MSVPSVQPPKITTWEPFWGSAALWKSRMSPGWSSSLVMRSAKVPRLPVHSLVGSFQAIDT